eukprot:Em0009g1050a
MDISYHQQEVSGSSLGPSQEYIVQVTLESGHNLAIRDKSGSSDPYVKFKQENFKYKSAVINQNLNPQWNEIVSFKTTDLASPLQMQVFDHDYGSADDFMGAASLNLDEFADGQVHMTDVGLSDPHCSNENLGYIRLFIKIDRNDRKLSISVDDGRQNDVTEESYGWRSSLKLESIKDVGQLKVKICGISGVNIGENANLFATLEVGNSQMRTDVVYKCASPMWNKTFCFNVKDILEDLEVTVYNEHKTDKNEFVGKVIIPLLRLSCGTAKRCALKDKHSNMKAKAGGVVMLECDLVYNYIKAAVRAFKPREVKMTEEKFNRKVMMSNIRRATYLGRTLLYTWHFIQSLWSWEDKWLSAISFFLFVVACLLAEVWMVFPLLIFLLLYGYMVVYMRGHHLWQIDSRRKSRHRDEDDEEESSMEELEGSELEDAAEDQSKTEISQMFKQLQRGLPLLQTFLGQLADLGERVQNFCRWRVPWLCWLAITVLTVAMVIVYFIPLRYIILAWGVDRFTKRLRNLATAEQGSHQQTAGYYSGMSYLSKHPCRLVFPL